MGTVLSFNPRDRHPIYSSQHQIPYGQSTNTLNERYCENRPLDAHLNNFSYEQLNNAKNRESNTVLCHQFAKNGQNQHNNCTAATTTTTITTTATSTTTATTTTNINLSNKQSRNRNNNNNNNNNKDALINNDLDLHNENSVILCEKTAIEKNFKKQSLFISALSWKKLASSHNKKRIENKNKCVNLPTACFKTQLMDSNYANTVSSDKNKNLQLHCNHIDEHHHQRQHQHHHHHHQLLNGNLENLQQAANTDFFHTNNNNNNNNNAITNNSNKSKKISTSTALDLVRVNNSNSISNHNKLIQKQTLALSLPQQLQPNINGVVAASSAVNAASQTTAANKNLIQTKNHNNNQGVPRKTVIQVNILFFFFFFFFMKKKTYIF